jgi:exodeoxyribonuclease V alpha subunit
VDASLETLEGAVERITFYNPENGYSVVRLRPRRGDVVTVVGNLPEVQPGESLRLTGAWGNHPEYGQQFKAETCQQLLPATIEGLRRYLGSGLIKGVGPRMAERIVKRFGLDTLRVLEEDPEQLRDVQGIGARRAEDIARAWRAQQAIKEVMLFLQTHGVSTGLAVKIYKQYGNEAIQIVQRDPYRLAREVFGIGFLTADRIATHMGLPHDAPSRIDAGVLYALGRQVEQGHVFVPREALAAPAGELLGVDPALIAGALDRLEAAREIIGEVLPVPPAPHSRPAQEGQAEQSAPAGPVEPVAQPVVYLKTLHHAEVGAANSLRAIASDPRSQVGHYFQGYDWPWLFRQLARLPGMNTVELSAQQQQAIRTALTNKLTILTGGPGTGKSTAMRALITALEQHHLRYALASPTGRAAKRLSEATGRPAMTIHRLLGYTPDGFQHDADNPLLVDMLIVDEASMLDILLANHLFKALPRNAHLLLVGDIDQLPSVGPGHVLRDLIRSGRCAVIRLETIFRQAAESLIIVNSHRIRQGEPLHTPADARDFFLFVKEDAAQAAELIVDLVARRMPARFGFDPRNDIQVLAPMHRGAAGVTELNRRLQAALNPPAPGKAERALAGGRTFRVGDRVMQTRNAYDRDVFNGDIGRITRIDLEGQTLAVDFDGREVEYDWSTVDELLLAYTVSIHKCAAEGTYLFTDQGLQPIEALWPDRGGVCFRPICRSIMSKDGWTHAAQIYCGGEEPVVSIKTRMGYSLTGSYRHPVLVYTPESGDLVWKKMPEIKEGDWIPIQRGQAAFPDKPDTTSDFCPQNSAKQSASCRIPDIVNPDLGAFLGYLVGDGTYTERVKNRIGFTNTDPQVLSQFGRLLDDLFGLDMPVHRSRSSHSYYVQNTLLRNFLLYLGLDYSVSQNKEVPHAVLRAPRETQAAFLRALYDCDGSAKSNSTRAVLVTASERLAEQVQLMLLNFGIFARRYAQWIETPRNGKKPYYRVECFGSNLVIFMREIGFSRADKAAALAKCVERSLRRGGKTNVDTIPEGRELIRAVKDAILERLPERTRGIKGAGCWGQLPFPIARLFQELHRGQCRVAYHHLDKILPVLQQTWPDLVTTPAYQKLSALHQARYFFDRVVSITEGQARVYDLIVPGVENFTTNGFISHNSQGSEYPAIVVPVLTQHFKFLQRNLLYTAVTRAKKVAVLVGSRKAIALALKNNEIAQRWTALDWRLR